jgi:formamidopyrimidine-DNA glycosylase
VPELPEVETVRRGLLPAMEGARFVKVEARRPDLRFALSRNFAKRLEGTTVRALNRRAKYLLADLSSGEVLLMHLGMSGSFRVDKASGQATHDHIVFTMSSGAAITYNDPRRFGFMKIIPPQQLATDPLLRWIGPEPLEPAFNAAVLAAACKGRKTSVKAALLDQRLVAGLGNIYVCEALYRAHISPKRPASVLASRSGEVNERAIRLAAAIKAVLNEAIAAGGSSISDHRRTDGELGYFQHSFRVYDREGERCRSPRCPGTVKRIVQSARSSFYCPVCQA